MEITSFMYKKLNSYSAGSEKCNNYDNQIIRTIQSRIITFN